MCGTGSRLAVDANAKFDRDAALAYAKALAPFGLRWFEEPCDPLDYALFAELASVYGVRLRPAKTCTRRRTWRTWCASAVCAPTATSSRSIRRRPTASCNTRTRSTCWRAMAGRAAAMFPHGGNQMSLHIAGGFGLGGAESYPGCVRRLRRICRRRTR